MREAASARAPSGSAPPTAQTSTAAPSQSRQRSKAFLFMTDFPPLCLILSKTCPLHRPERKDLSTATFSLRRGKPCPYKTRHRRDIVPVHRLGGAMPVRLWSRRGNSLGQIGRASCRERV